MMMMIFACSISVASSFVRFFFRFDEIYLCLARKVAAKDCDYSVDDTIMDPAI